MEEAKSTTGRRIDEEGVDHPAHYNTDVSGVECIEIVRYMGFNVGNAFKYLFRAGRKVSTEDTLPSEIKDLAKASWYLKDEVAHLKFPLTQRRSNRHIYEEKMMKVINSRDGNVKEAMVLLHLGSYETAIAFIEVEIMRLTDILLYRNGGK